MCFGGGSSQSSTPAQAAPVTSTAPEFAAEAYDEETASESQDKKRRGKRNLRITRNQSSANVYGDGAGLNIPANK